MYRGVYPQSSKHYSDIRRQLISYNEIEYERRYHNHKKRELVPSNVTDVVSDSIKTTLLKAFNCKDTSTVHSFDLNSHKGIIIFRLDSI